MTAVRIMNKSISTLLALAAATMSAGAALAQNAAPAPQPGPSATEAPKPWAPKWSNINLEQIAKMMIGSWKSGSVAQNGGDQTRTEIQMNISPIVVTGMTDTLYVEIARVDSPWVPYRQAIFQLANYKGGVRLRTYEFNSSPKINPVLVGLWLVPEMFPEVKGDELLATIDIDLKPSGTGYAGKSPYPYPTGLGGAFEMTSEFAIENGEITSVDRGYDTSGKIVWGSGENDKYTFKRFEPATKLIKLDSGMIRIDFREATSPLKIEAGDTVAAHYTGWLYNNGTVVDTTRDRNPLVFEQGKLMPGFNSGLLGIGPGSLVRLVIPPMLAYGANGAGRVIPPNATLVYEIEIMDTQKRTPESAPAAAPVQPPAVVKPAVPPKAQ